VDGSRHRHNVIYAIADSDTDATRAGAYAGARRDSFKLRCATPLSGIQARTVGRLAAIVASISQRRVVPARKYPRHASAAPDGVNSFEIVQTLLAYADDDEDMVEHPCCTANLMGPPVCRDGRRRGGGDVWCRHPGPAPHAGNHRDGGGGKLAENGRGRRTYGAGASVLLRRTHGLRSRRRTPMTGDLRTAGRRPVRRLWLVTRPIPLRGVARPF